MAHRRRPGLDAPAQHGLCLKNLSLRDWMIFSQRYGSGFLEAITAAQKGDRPGKKPGELCTNGQRRHGRAQPGREHQISHMPASPPCRSSRWWTRSTAFTPSAIGALTWPPAAARPSRAPAATSSAPACKRRSRAFSWRATPRGRRSASTTAWTGPSSAISLTRSRAPG
jgi:hypothetical protein